MQISEEDPSAGDASQPRRRPWLAAVLSLLAPGLGHLYAGFVFQAFFVVAAWGVAGATIVWLYTTAFDNPFPFWLATAILVGAYVIVPAHAALVARSGAPIPLGRALRVGVYIVWLVAFSEVAGRSAAWVRAEISEPFRVPSSAMYPTLQVGDHFFADKHPYSDTEPQRGDVIVFEVARDESQIFPADERPDLPRERFVKRIVGLPGDLLGLSSAGLSLNGKPVATTAAGPGRGHGRGLDLYTETIGARAHAIARDPAIRRSPFHEVVVPAGRYFTMGDNRDHSNDSRHWGTVARADIVARVSHLYFASDPESGNIAWARIGSRVE